jgi:hypothetical protein
MAFLPLLIVVAIIIVMIVVISINRKAKDTKYYGKPSGYGQMRPTKYQPPLYSCIDIFVYGP